LNVRLLCYILSFIILCNLLKAAFGVALSQLADKPPKGAKWSQIFIVQILEELMNICMKFVGWIIWCAPPCILSLIAAAIGKQSEMGQVLQTIGWLFVSLIVGLLAQVLVVYCGLYYFYQRSNPFDYFKHMIEAMTLAFACASSAATLPVTLECVHKTGKVPPGVANFVLPLGATVNMDGSAIWMINACIALAYLNGITPTAANYFVLAFVSTLGTIGAAPIPSAGMILTLTIYETTFGTIDGSAVPYGFGFILAIDWLADRFVTMFNVMGDTVVAALVSRDLDSDDDFEIQPKQGEGTSKSSCSNSVHEMNDYVFDVKEIKRSIISDCSLLKRYGRPKKTQMLRIKVHKSENTTIMRTLCTLHPNMKSP
jgi:Na+/H+-dicarboxylate symporter